MAESIVTRLYCLHDRMRREGARSHVQRSDFVTRLAAPLVIGRWRERHGEPPRPRAALSNRETELLDGIVDAGLESLLSEANDACGRAMGEVARLLSRRGDQARPSEFSERVSVWVRQRLAAGKPPEQAECEQFARRIVGETPVARPVGAEEFRMAFAEPYDRLWQQRGAANLAQWPPAPVGLGSDRRPPLLRGVGAARRDWSQGTGRPVYERYRLWFKGSATVTPPRCSDAACQTRRTVDRAEVVATSAGATEVARACQGYGLEHLEHRQVVRSLSLGLSQSWGGGGWTTWERWAEPCRPIQLDAAQDAELADAVASAVAAWTRGDVGAGLIAEYGRESLHGPLRIIVMRKAWMDLLGYERTFADPIRRCGIPKIVRTALYRLVQQALPDWLDGRIGDLDDDLPPDPSASTMALLTEHPAVARLILADQGSWREAYEWLTAAARPGFLTADQARALLQELVEGMDR